MKEVRNDLWSRFLVEYGVTRTRYTGYVQCRNYATEGNRYAVEQWAAWKLYLADLKMKGEL